MIDKAINTLQIELGEYLAQFTATGSEPTVKALSLNEAAPTANTLGLTVVSIEEERVNKAQNPYTVHDGVTVKRNPELHFNVFVMFTAYGSNGTTADYDESLKLLSRAITFFQGKKVFTPENTPHMDATLERLYLDVHNLNSEQQNDLWGKFEQNYSPSICYRMRLIAVQNNLTSGEAPAITSAGMNLKHSI